MTALWDSFKSLLFPPRCLHCKSELQEELNLLCQDCLDLVDLVDPSERCEACFKEVCCCKKEGPLPYNKMAYCFEYEGPQKSLLHAFKYGDKPYLAKSLASFMIIQFEKLGWSLPSIITYIPAHFMRTSLRGYNQSKLLAEEVAKLLAIDCVPLLSRPDFFMSQSLLTKEARKALPSTSFRYKGPKVLKNMSVMLIDDVITTGTTAMNACRVIEAYIPKEITLFCLMRAEN